MQYLKDNIKDNIIKAAIKEFSQKGYLDSSMREIAHNAGIVMGNIYRYFRNKEEMFNICVGPVYGQISCITTGIQEEIKKLSGPWKDRQAMELIKQIYSRILETFSGHGAELLILLDKSKGSKYENTKEELTLQIKSILETRLIPETNIDDTFILYVLAAAFVEGICVVLRDNGSHDKEALIGSLANIMLCQISKRI